MDNGKLSGVEVDLEKKLFKSLGFSLDFSYIWSRVNIPTYYSRQTPFHRPSPYLINANIIYNFNNIGLEMTGTVNILGYRISGVSLQGTRVIYEQGRPTLDAQIKKRMNNRISIVSNQHIPYHE